MSLPPRVRDIISQVAEENRLTPAAILGRSRVRPVARARMVAMARVRALRPKPSFPLIGRWFGCDHTTVIHALRVLAAESAAVGEPGRELGRYV